MQTPMPVYHNSKEEHQLKDMNAREMEQLEKQLFPIRNLGIVLLDVIPIEQKAILVQGLRRLVGDSEIPDFRLISGLLPGRWSQNVGRLVNEKLDGWFPGAVKSTLPNAFAWVEVEVGQCFSFCLYIKFRCFIRPEFQDRIKESFVDANTWVCTLPGPHDESTHYFARKGPELDPTVVQYQRDIEAFLKKFIPSAFLSQSVGESNSLHCPSVRVLSAEKIGFEKYGDWFINHEDLLSFVGMNGPASRLDHYVIGYQQARLFADSGMFAGLTFVNSESDHMPVTKEKRDGEMFTRASDIFEEYLLPYYVAIYLTAYHLDVELSDWQRKWKDLGANLRRVLDEKRFPGVRSLEPIYSSAMTILNSFESFAFAEEKNIREMGQSSWLSTAMPKSSALDWFRSPLNIIDDFASAKRLLAEEREMLSIARLEIRGIVEQCRQHADFALQNNVRKLSYATFVVALAALFVSIAAFRSDLMSFLAWLASLCT
jgi:hypothetical protein